MNVLKRLIQVGSFSICIHFFFFFLKKKKKFSALWFNLVIFSSSGPQSVQVWPYKDLLPSRSGGLPGEAASGPAERRLRHHPEALPGVEPEEEVPAHEAGSHHPAGLRPWEEDNPVGGLDLLVCWSFFGYITAHQQGAIKLLIDTCGFTLNLIFPLCFFPHAFYWAFIIQTYKKGLKKNTKLENMKHHKRT